MTGHQSRILIVDDDPALLKALPEMLELRAQGMSVETSDSAEAALERIKAVDYDAIVTDIKMPGMDGVTLLTRVRELRPETPALLITGHGEHDLAVQSLRAGAFDYIQKPIDRNYFIAALNRAIQVRALRRQVAQQQEALARHVAELEAAVQRRTRQLAETAERLGALTNLATAIHAATDIDAVLWSVADAARRLSDSEIAVAAAFPSRADARSNEIPPQIAVAPRAGHGTIDMPWMAQWITSTWDRSRQGSGSYAEPEGWTIAAPAGPEAGIGWVGAPVLTRGGEVVGAIVLGHSDRSWSPDVSRAQIEALARQATVALENVRRYQREHAIAETLQRALLPASLPNLPGLKLDVVYRPGGQNSEIGGDWYDVFRLPDGALALSVGDVAGHGLDAAVIMGQVRQSIRSAAIEGHSPFVVLERASTALRLTDEINGMATAVFGVLDPVSLNFTYATAGHPAPVLLTADGEVQMLTSGGLPLGVEGPAIPRSWSITLPMHSLLVLYTDGLIECTRDIVEGEAALVAAVRAEFGSPSANPAAAILERATVAAAPADDIAILTVSLDPVALEHFDLTLPATPPASSIARQSLRRLANSLGVPENNVFAWQVALGEAVNNAIEHAYGAGQGTVRLQAHVFDTQLVLQVEDHGQWRSERVEGRGYGIRIMEAMVNRMEIRRSDSGTTVRLIADLAGRRPEQAHAPHGLGALGERGRRTPGRVLLRSKRSSRTGGPVQAGARFEIRRVRGIPTVVVDGELDVSNARSFEAALVRAAKTDRHVVVVSLDKVTYLDSYAINVLLRFGERLTQNRQSLALVLPEQEAGRRILEITDMKGRYPVFPSIEQALDGSTQVL